ncbi:MAG: hypothetical protein ACJ8ER_01830 [Allosphingosinicella sp.]
MTRNIAFALAAIMLSSCAPPSNTPEGFTAKTDIALCKEAHVTDVNKNDPSRRSGLFTETYLVRVKMSEKCAQDFFRDLERSSGERCQNRDSCQVLSRRGPSITAAKVGSGEYEIVWIG